MMLLRASCVINQSGHTSKCSCSRSSSSSCCCCYVVVVVLLLLLLGIISREDAENQLCGKWAGSFLVRVSDKIYGYVISYHSDNSTTTTTTTTAQFKHFLVDATGACGYRMFGAADFVHQSLYNLVEYHSVSWLNGGAGSTSHGSISCSSSSSYSSSHSHSSCIICSSSIAAAAVILAVLYSSHLSLSTSPTALSLSLSHEGFSSSHDPQKQVKT